MRGRVVVNLTNLKNNATAIRERVKSDAKIFWVVKADAYGHGIEAVVKTLNSADGFCVATVEEGIEIRKFFTGEVLVLGKTCLSEKITCLKNGLSVTVWRGEDVEELNCITADMNECISVHIAVNTGMNRIGVNGQKPLYKLINDVISNGNIQIKGVFSHLFDAKNQKSSEIQRSRFLRLTDGIDKKIARHISASGKAFDGKFAFDCVRIGFALYGYGEDWLIPCMSVFGEVVCVNKIKKGESVGYGGLFVADEDCLVATLSLGYADGVLRSRTGGCVIIKGKRRKIVGAVCMDCCFARVDGEVKSGDRVVFMGKDGDEEITAEEIALWQNTSPYEVLTTNKRIKTEYVN